MIVLKRRSLLKRIAYSYRAYRALGMSRYHAFRSALSVAIVRKVLARPRSS